MDKPNPVSGVPWQIKWFLFYPAILAIVSFLIASVVEILSAIFGWS